MNFFFYYFVIIAIWSAFHDTRTTSLEMSEKTNSGAVRYLYPPFLENDGIRIPVNAKLYSDKQTFNLDIYFAVELNISPGYIIQWTFKNTPGSMEIHTTLTNPNVFTLESYGLCEEMQENDGDCNLGPFDSSKYYNLDIQMEGNLVNFYLSASNDDLSSTNITLSEFRFLVSSLQAPSKINGLSPFAISLQTFGEACGDIINMYAIVYNPILYNSTNLSDSARSRVSNLFSQNECDTGKISTTLMANGKAVLFNSTTTETNGSAFKNS